MNACMQLNSSKWLSIHIYPFCQKAWAENWNWKKKIFILEIMSADKTSLIWYEC